MKKIVLNLSDYTYEKLRFEAIFEKKDVKSVIADRLMHKEFHPEVEEAFDKWMEEETNKILGG